MSLDGAAILYSRGHYDRSLALARLRILPFFWQPRLASSRRRSRGIPSFALAVLTGMLIIRAGYRCVGGSGERYS